MEENPLGIHRFLMTFVDGISEGRLTARISGREYQYPVGLDGVCRFSDTSHSGDPAALRGRWETQERFTARLHQGDTDQPIYNGVHLFR